MKKECPTDKACPFDGFIGSDVCDKNGTPDCPDYTQEGEKEEHKIMKKILVAVPTLNKVDVKFVASWANIVYGHGIEDVVCHPQFVVDSMTYTARINLAEIAVNGDFDYVLWMDSDMVIPQDALKKMLKADKEMVTGLYFQRRGDHAPVIYSKVDEKERIVCEDYPKDKLFQIAACGFGCVLMKTDVIRIVARASGGLTFQPYDGIGEDLSFCYRWGKAWGEIWCDPTIKCGHIGEYVFTEEDWHD